MDAVALAGSRIDWKDGGESRLDQMPGQHIREEAEHGGAGRQNDGRKQQTQGSLVRRFGQLLLLQLPGKALQHEDHTVHKGENTGQPGDNREKAAPLGKTEHVHLPDIQHRCEEHFLA
ncbi:hypothetical protein D3C76_1343250 [compost metagenome]